MLVGLAAGAVIVAITRAAWIMAMIRGGAVVLNPLPNRMLNNALPPLYAIGNYIPQAAIYTVATLIVLLLLRLLFRRTAAAICGGIVIYGLLGIGAGGLFDFGVGVIGGSILMMLLFRFGALTTAAALFSYFTLRSAPLTMRIGEPFGRLALMVMLPIAAIAAIGFYITLAGKPMFGAIGVEDEVAALRDL